MLLRLEEEAQNVLEQLPGWFEDYNNNALHKGLKIFSPTEYYRASQEDLKQVGYN